MAATLISIWAASRVMTSLMEGFRAAYHIRTGRPFLRQQGMAILLVPAAALPLLAASGLVLFGNRTEQLALRWLGLLPAGQEIETWVRLLASGARYAVAITANVAVAATLYSLGPNRPQRWRNIWPGAVVATALWLVSTLGFAWYVRNMAGYNVLYGSIGAAIALLVWMYVLAAVVLLGCEIVRSMVLGVQVFGDRLHVWVEEAVRGEPAVREALTRGGLSLESMRVIEPSLEDVFVSVVSGERA